MKSNNKKVLVVASLAALSSFLWMSFSEDTSPEPTMTEMDLKPSKNQNHMAAEPVKTIAAVKKTSTQTPQKEVFLTQAVRDQMEHIAIAYETNMQFPTYSKPLSMQDWNLLNPRPFIEKPVPLDFDESVSASIVLEHYIAHRDEPLNVEVQVSGLSKDSLDVEEVVAFIVGDQERRQSSALASIKKDSNTQVFKGSLSQTAFESLANSENQIAAEIAFSNNENALVTAVFKLVGTDATLVEIQEAYVEGAHLMIPAQFDVVVPGYYRVQGNLFDSKTNRPVTHINTAFMLTQSDNVGLLKVHAVTLRNQGLEGPYELTDLNITRGPAHPGDQTGYGKSKELSYHINGFDLEVYDDSEYVDPKAQQRLEFLQRLAGTE